MLELNTCMYMFDCVCMHMYMYMLLYVLRHVRMHMHTHKHVVATGPQLGCMSCMDNIP